MKLNIKHPSDWGKVTKKQILANDGASFINIYYGSVKRAITSVLEGMVFLLSQQEDTTWKEEWFSNANKFPSGYWSKKENQREFLNNLAKKLDVLNPSDWKKVSRKEVIENDGGTLLFHYGTLRNALVAAFSGKQYLTRNSSRYRLEN